MAKVGILSMQRIANYGSFLQAYALKSMVEELGHEVQFVDYHVGKPLVEDKEESQNKLIRKLKKVMEVFTYHAPLSHKIKFIFYKKNFGKRYYPILGISEDRNYSPELDVLIIGSDEVFNCVQKNSNVGYSPDLFGKNNQAKRLISYAASFGNTTIEKLEQYGKREEIAELLKQFDAISVRDKNSGRIVECLTGNKPLYHLDPVLVYDYMNKCNRIPDFNIEEKYMILYAYSERISSEESREIRKFADKNGLKIYAIGGVQECADKFIDCSPFEVLAYFKNAEYVVTDTFHGTIFSVITERPFATIVRKSVGSEYGNEEKLMDLLDRLGLMQRCIGSIDEFDNVINQKILYKNVLERVAVSKNETHIFLSSFLFGGV